MYIMRYALSSCSSVVVMEGEGAGVVLVVFIIAVRVRWWSAREEKSSSRNGSSCTRVVIALRGRDR